MKPNYYIVTFENGITVFVRCMDEEEAEILAKAIMIQNGLTREIQSVRKTMNTECMTKTDFVAPVWG